jgi:hypothetical protein
MTGQIPTKTLVAARLKLSRQVASVLIMAFAESGMSCKELEDKLGEASGYFKSYIDALIDGRETNLELMSDVALACGYEPTFTFGKIKAEVASSEEGAA